MRANLDTDFFNLPLPRALAHRGSSGAYPENTMPAFQAAVDAGADYLELDVHLTRDGQVVVAHDPDLTRMCGRPGRISELDYQEVARADAGWGFTPDGSGFRMRGCGIVIPRLAEVLSSFPMTRIVIEIKPAETGVAEKTLAVIDGARMRRMVLLASEHQVPVSEARALAPALPTNLPSPEVSAFFQAMAAHDTAYRAPGDALQIPPEYESWTLVTAESVALAHHGGLEVHVWTVNDEAQMQDLLALGVDGIFSDFPERLLGVIKRLPGRA